MNQALPGKDGPFYFGSDKRRLFGWIHAARADAPSGPSRNVGVVLCNPFGFEALCMHRSIRHFAEAFAHAGYPSLRFDYDGTGDSCGDDLDPDRVRAWLDSIHSAVDVLKQRSGVESVYLFGIRLGAALAATAAAERKDCSGLIALAPVISPEYFLRELAAFQSWGRLQKSPDGVTGVEDGDREASGFVITAATVAALSSLDLTKQSSAPAPRVLVLERDKRSSSLAWTGKIKDFGVDVDVRNVDGYAEMSIDPHKTVIPDRMIATSIEWLGAGPSDKSGPSSTPLATTQYPVCVKSEVGFGVIEAPVFIDSERTLFGVVAHSGGSQSSGRAFIILNAGSQHRIGPNRLWVKFSREWARTGAIVLRLDISGIGDSRTRPGEQENDVYAKAGTTDISDAIEYLRREWGARTFDVIGLCGSAYHAVKAAAQGVPLDSVLAINQQVFFWDPKRGIDEFQSVISTEVRRYRNELRNVESWKKLIRGKIQFRAASRIFRRRFIDFCSNQGRDIARRLYLPMKNDLGAELGAIAKRKVCLRFMFCNGEGGAGLLYELAGAMGRRLESKGAFSVEWVPGADHTFTAVWTHRMLKERLDSWLGLSQPRLNLPFFSETRIEMIGKKPIRVGILMDGLELPAWIAELVRDILKDPCAEIALLVIHDQSGVKALPQPQTGISGKIMRFLSGRTDLKKTLWHHYSRWDNARVKPSDDPFFEVNLTEELRDVPRMQVIPKADRFYHRFEEKDLTKIREANLDVLLRFGFNIIKGPILESARFGVWSFHHGDNQHIRGGPPYFWELYNDVPLSGVMLQILGEKLDSGRVLYRSYGSTMRGMSVKWNSISSYWKGSSFVIRRLRQLHQYGFEWMLKELPSLQENPSIQGKLYRTPTNSQAIRFITFGLWRSLFKRLRMRGKIEHWYVSYRDRKGSGYITLPAPKGHYYADPFPIQRDGKDYIFFEDYIYSERRGLISYVEVRPDLSTSETKVVLNLPYHLSYPFLFEHQGVVHMIPETGGNNTVELYKAVEFPERWELVKVLNRGLKAYDVTLLVRGGVYWFFAAVVERGEASSDELFLYHAESLTGEWIPHPKNPVLSDVRRARPAGKIFERDGKLIRPSQDGSLSYGCAYYLNEIIVLSKTDYQERPIEHVPPDWAPHLVGTHTYNFSERLEVIDVRAVLPISEVL